MLAFRDPDTFVAGNIHACFPAWESIAKIAPFKLTPNILRWIQDCVDVREFFQPFKGQYKGESFTPLVGSSLTPFHVNLLHSSFLKLLLTVYHLGLSPQMPLTIEPSKPRLCNDNRFLNLWTRDVPFKLDSLAGLPRYVFPSSFQPVCDDKSDYDYVLLSPESRPYFGFEWGGWYFTSNTIPFGWKASAYVYHSIGLLASHYFHSLHIPCSLYIDDRHMGEIQLSPSVPGYASLSSDLDKSLVRANSAIFLVCFTPINLGYFLGIKKSILIPRQIVPLLGFLVDSVRQSFLLIEEKKQKFLSLLRLVLDSDTTDVKRLLGKCISFSLAIPGTRLFLNEVYNVIGKGLRYGWSKLIPISGPLREELQQWLFLESWSGCLPWGRGAHCQVKLCTDASSFA